MNASNSIETEKAQGAAAERVSYILPAVDIYETESGYTLEADMPGVTRESLEIYLDQNELTLLGRRVRPAYDLRHYRESGAGEFRRVFELDPEIDTETITARVENGVLSLHLAKREEVKPRRIAITD